MEEPQHPTDDENRSPQEKRAPEKPRASSPAAPSSSAASQEGKSLTQLREEMLAARSAKPQAPATKRAPEARQAAAQVQQEKPAPQKAPAPQPPAPKEQPHQTPAPAPDAPQQPRPTPSSGALQSALTMKDLVEKKRGGTATKPESVPAPQESKAPAQKELGKQAEPPKPTPPTPKAQTPAPQQQRVTTPKAAPNVASKPGTESVTPAKQHPPADGVAADGDLAAADTGLVRRLRTYKEDVARAVKEQNASSASIAIAEATAKQDKPATEKLTPAKRGGLMRILLIALIVLFVAGGIGAGIWAFLASTAEQEGPTRFTVTSFFFTDAQKEVPTAGRRGDELREAIARAVDANALSLGSVEQLYLTKSVQNADSTNRLAELTAAEFFDAIEARVRASFTRALASQYMVGSHVFDGVQPFIVVRVASFENAFAGMLAWEGTMSEDLAPIFGSAVTPLPSSTTTPAVARPFADEVLRNQDVRILRDEAGEPAILYTFPNRSTLIITTNEYTLVEILTRLTTARTL